MDLLLNTNRPSKKTKIPTLLKVFHEIEREATLPHSFYETSITSIPKHKDTTKRKRNRPCL
jgi:hypothetical protein